MRWTLIVLVIIAGAILAALASAVYPMPLTAAPERALAPPASIEAPAAYLAIPFVLPVEQIKSTVRESLSEKLFAETVKVPGRDLQVTVERDGPLVLWLRKARLHMELPLEFEIEGDLETDGEITLITDARFDVAPDWNPALDVKTTFRWDWQPRVGFWPFRIRIGDRLEPYIQKALNQESAKIEQTARERFKLRQLAEAGWKQLQTPIALKSPRPAEPPQWLLLRPHAAWLEPVTSDATDIRINFWIGAQPLMLEGEQAPPGGSLPLPELQKGKPPANRLVLDHRLVLSYADAAERVLGQIAGQAIRLPAGSVLIEKLEMYPAGERLALSLTVRSRRDDAWWSDRAKLHLTGDLAYDPAQNALRLADLQLAPTRFNPLGWHTRWAEQPVLAETLAAAAHWPMEKEVADRRAWLDTELARVDAPGFDLWGGLVGTQPTRAQLFEHGIGLGLRSYGEMAVMFSP
ncbi:MAG: DUF4403 family protein [Nevskiales bacterium]